MQYEKINAKHLCYCRCIGHNYNITTPEDKEELKNVEDDSFLLGSGTNTLLHNQQKNQIVSLKKLDKITISNNMVTAGAGTSLPSLINYLKKINLGGLEFTYPIPASLGGAVWQNFGAYQKNISDYIITVDCYDKQTKTFITLSKNECNFNYRNSIFKTNRFIILSVKLCLENNDEKNINKLCKISKETREKAYPLNYNLGSTFKNPQNLSAGKIIEDCGLKGYKHKTVQICQSHANIIICEKNSTTSDFLELIELIKLTVKNKHGINLETEISIY